MSRKRKFEDVDSDNSDADYPTLPPQKKGVNVEDLPYSRPNNSHIKNKMRNKYQLQVWPVFSDWIDQIPNRQQNLIKYD